MGLEAKRKVNRQVLEISQVGKGVYPVDSHPIQAGVNHPSRPANSSELYLGHFTDKTINELFTKAEEQIVS
jgi:hypothetical protein